MLLDDVTKTEGEATHQHINHVYFASTEEVDVNPQGDDEVDPEEWFWVSKAQLENEEEPFDVDPLTRELCLEAINHIQNNV